MRASLIGRRGVRQPQRAAAEGVKEGESENVVEQVETKSKKGDEDEASD